MSVRWYTVEYDEKRLAWLVADDKDRVCLVHGMQLRVAELAITRPLAGEAPARTMNQSTGQQPRPLPAKAGRIPRRRV